MSNKASSNLHQLIKSLTKAEKRYFKVYSSRHTIGDKNNYQMIFDAIEKQTAYDEDAILRKFKNESFINKFSFSFSICSRHSFSFHSVCRGECCVGSCSQYGIVLCSLSPMIVSALGRSRTNVV